VLLTLSQTGIQPAVRPLDQIPVLDDRPLAVLARAARLRGTGEVLLVRDEKEDKKVKNIEGPIDVLISALVAIAGVLVVVALVFLTASLANPCCVAGHTPMAPAEYGCAKGANWTATLTLCRADIQVCRRCKLVYLSRVEAGTEKKP